ncbi:TVP38/TMEM64 family protein [Evansella tamaricis]|uniref:TVP38/TMEM64 family membrane protein n=1 Tax=Evansella tamaricis TaxID=2069301 RepID=A0ABS6JFC6_9BACI|nr:VTT domain-containing protein [Evansella tamaricis]MBU9712363.1 VTT domain-containing protein [Evansella tamaricis]
MKYIRILLLLGFIGFIIYMVWDWIGLFMQQDIEYFTAESFLGELGLSLLWVTIPLMIVQGIFTLFPVLILIILHFISFGVVGGFIISVIGATLGALVCYWLTDSFSSQWVERFWNKREKTLNWLLRLMTTYGVLIIVLLRSIPFVPSNLISISAALSPVTLQQYVWSSVLGNISMVWLLSLLSAPLWMTESIFLPYLVGYIIYVITLVGFYSYRYYQKKRLIPQQRARTVRGILKKSTG